MVGGLSGIDYDAARGDWRRGTDGRDRAAAGGRRTVSVQGRFRAPGRRRGRPGNAARRSARRRHLVRQRGRRLAGPRSVRAQGGQRRPLAVRTAAAAAVQRGHRPHVRPAQQPEFRGPELYARRQRAMGVAGRTDVPGWRCARSGARRREPHHAFCARRQGAGTVCVSAGGDSRRAGPGQTGRQRHLRDPGAERLAPAGAGTLGRAGRLGPLSQLRAPLRGGHGRRHRRPAPAHAARRAVHADDQAPGAGPEPGGAALRRQPGRDGIRPRAAERPPQPGADLRRQLRQEPGYAVPAVRSDAIAPSADACAATTGAAAPDRGAGKPSAEGWDKASGKASANAPAAAPGTASASTSPRVAPTASVANGSAAWTGTSWMDGGDRQLSHLQHFSKPGDASLNLRRMVGRRAARLDDRVIELAVTLEQLAVLEHLEADFQLAGGDVLQARLEVRFGERGLAMRRCRVVHGAQFLRLRIVLDQEELLQALVGVVVQQRAFGVLAVAARAARLLVVRLEVGRNLQVDHEARVGLVDAHAEGIGGHHHAALAAHEQVLVLAAFGRAQLAVVQRHALPRLVQLRMQFFRRLDGGRVHDAHAGRLAHQLQRLRHLFVRVGHLLDAVVQIGTVDAGVDHRHARASQLGADIGNHVRGRGGREREHLRAPQGVERGADFQVRGTEVVAPLRDAVRFVDHHQRDLAMLEQRQEVRRNQAFGRAEDDVVIGRFDAFKRGQFFRARQAAVDLGRIGNARLLEFFRLVLHQRDQGRHHHRHAVEQPRRHLVAQRLAAAGGHHGQRVVAGQHAVDHVALASSQRRRLALCGITRRRSTRMVGRARHRRVDAGAALERERDRRALGNIGQPRRLRGIERPREAQRALDHRGAAIARCVGRVAGQVQVDLHRVQRPALAVRIHAQRDCRARPQAGKNEIVRRGTGVLAAVAGRFVAGEPVSAHLDAGGVHIAPDAGRALCHVDVSFGAILAAGRHGAGSPFQQTGRPIISAPYSNFTPASPK
uniref:Uncharacterized protein n=1 Tax=Tanacetum cinerariifolium TaxID=118510 RepID=A0A699GFY0_TANCI|nr:hypothetical protein [Tanacetum cinerariifolium]